MNKDYFIINNLNNKMSDFSDSDYSSDDESSCNSELKSFQISSHGKTIGINQNFDGNFTKKLLNNIKKCKVIHFNCQKVDLKDILSEMNNLKEISFDNIYYCDVSFDKLPNNLESITFSDSFNKPVNNLPSGLKTITFGEDFNKSVNNLPPELETITFGKKFNKSVNNLPFKLKKIYFGKSFNQSVDMLPESVEELSFVGDFNQPIDTLPRNLKKIEFYGSFNKSVDMLPDSITTIIIDSDFNQKINKLPESLQHFDTMGDKYSLTSNVLQQCQNLITLQLHQNHSGSLECLKHLTNLKVLKTNCDFKEPFKNLPKSLKHLFINEYDGTLAIYDNIDVHNSDYSEKRDKLLKYIYKSYYYKVNYFDNIDKHLPNLHKLIFSNNFYKLTSNGFGYKHINEIIKNELKIPEHISLVL